MKTRHVTRSELKLGILKMMRGGARKYGKKYFRPTLKTQVKLLLEIQGIDTSLRTLCRAIRELINEKYLWRKNRHTRGKGIKMVCRATAYYLLDKAMQLFKKMMLEARNFIRPLGVPSMAQDRVPQEHYYSSSVVLGGVLNNIWPTEGRASPLLGPSGS